MKNDEQKTRDYREESSTHEVELCSDIFVGWQAREQDQACQAYGEKYEACDHGILFEAGTLLEAHHSRVDEAHGASMSSMLRMQ